MASSSPRPVTNGQPGSGGLARGVGVRTSMPEWVVRRTGFAREWRHARTHRDRADHRPRPTGSAARPLAHRRVRRALPERGLELRDRRARARGDGAAWRERPHVARIRRQKSPAGRPSRVDLAPRHRRPGRFRAPQSVARKLLRHPPAPVDAASGRRCSMRSRRRRGYAAMRTFTSSLPTTSRTISSAAGGRSRPSTGADARFP